jgi:hypothetical protein
MIGPRVNGLYERDATVSFIKSGKRLLLAGDEALLAALPKGDWIGGTIPYFMTSEGGLHSVDRVFVTELPGDAGTTIHRYDAARLPGIAADHPGHGFTVLLVPAFTEIHTEFAKHVADYPGIYDRPLVGWVSGVALEDIGKVQPKVFDGSTGIGSADHAIAFHVALPEADRPSVDIINLFRPGPGDAIAFPAFGFSVTEALINGRPTNFARYLSDRNSDTRLPLVADYNGAMINVAVRKIDAASGTVDFYAPVFPDVDYRIAAPVADYVAGFAALLPADGPRLTFACNCVLNYLYAGLEGRSTAPLTGPMTFGEIAYLLLNQTAVYLTVSREAEKLPPPDAPPQTPREVLKV